MLCSARCSCLKPSKAFTLSVLASCLLQQALLGLPGMATFMVDIQSDDALQKEVLSVPGICQVRACTAPPSIHALQCTAFTREGRVPCPSIVPCMHARTCKRMRMSHVCDHATKSRLKTCAPALQQHCSMRHPFCAALAPPWEVGGVGSSPLHVASPFIPQVSSRWTTTADALALPAAHCRPHLLAQIVELYPDWCGPCKAIQSTFRRIYFDAGDRPLKFFT